MDFQVPRFLEAQLLYNLDFCERPEKDCFKTNKCIKLTFFMLYNLMKLVIAALIGILVHEFKIHRIQI